MHPPKVGKREKIMRRSKRCGHRLEPVAGPSLFSNILMLVAYLYIL